MTLTRHIGVLLLVCILPMLSSCREIPTSVKVGNGPSFSFHGSGRLASFRIYGPQPGYKIATPFDAKSVVWRVQPTEGYFKGARVEGLKIEYGSIPEDRVRQYSGRVHAGDTKQWNRLCAASGASLLFLCGNDECAPSRGFLLPRWDHANSDQSSWVVSERVRRRREGTEMRNQRALY